MYCPKCGVNNPEGAQICSKCGAPLAPPQAYPPAQPKSNGLLIGCIVAAAGAILFGMIILAAILFPVFARARESARTSSCQSNLKELAVSAQLYSQDYNGKLPASSKWCDAIYPGYNRTATTFVCPAQRKEGNVKCSYGMNSNLGGINLGNLDSTSRYTPMLFESNGGWNASGTSGSLVSPPRHGPFYCFVFADTHVSRVGSSDMSWVRWNVRGK